MILFDLARKNRRAFNRLAVAFFVLFVVAVVDLALFTLTESKSTFKVVVGGQVNISGKLSEPIDAKRLRPVVDPRTGRATPVDLNAFLTAEPVESGYRIRFSAVEGRLWRGVLVTAPSVQPGEFRFRVLNAESAEVSGDYRLFVYPDAPAYRRSFLSLTKRWLGIDPLWVPIALLPVGILFFVATFRAARLEDRRLQDSGIGPIYKLARRKDHWEVVFGLGSRNGVRPGDRLRLLNANRESVGDILVDSVGPDAAHAKLDIGIGVRPEFLVAKQGPEKAEKAAVAEMR